MLKNPPPYPGTISIRCHRPASKPSQTARSKSSSKTKLSLSELSHTPTLCHTDRESSYLTAVYLLLHRVMPHLPPLEGECSASQVFEEVKAGIAVIGKVMEAREVQSKEREDRLKAAIEDERQVRVQLEQQLQDLSSMDELQATKAIIKQEEDDLQRKMTFIEQKMNETLALKDTFERNFGEREADLRHREGSLRREEVRAVAKGKELNMKEKVLNAFERTLLDSKRTLDAERDTFRAAKSQWYSSHSSSECEERAQMIVEDCRSRMLTASVVLSQVHLSQQRMATEVVSLRQDRAYLDDTTQMLEALHEEILHDRREMAEDVKVMQGEWDLIKAEKARLREAWEVLKMKKEEQRSGDPSTEESPGKLPEYRTPTDSWSTGFMSLHPISFSESPILLRKL